MSPSVTTHNCAAMGVGVGMILAGRSRSATTCETKASVISTIFHRDLTPTINSSATDSMSPVILEQLSTSTESEPLPGVRTVLLSELSQKQAVPFGLGRAAMLGSRESLTL